MATIRKRQNKYQVQVRRKGFAPTVRSFTRKTDAEEWARFMEAKIDRGELPSPVKVLDQYTVAQILERYRDEISIKKQSYDTERYVLNALIRQSFSKLTLAQITPEKFATYRDKRLKTVTTRTVKRELDVMKHAFDIAQREWDIPIRENPLSKLPKIKPQQGRSRRLEEGEKVLIERVGMTVKNPLVMPVVRFALATAMRRGEILKMRWQDINLTAKTLHIPITKNGYARTIPLSPDALEILHTLKDNRQQGNRVFPISDNACKLAWQRLIKRAGIEDLHFHDLRHEAISRFFEIGLSVPEVALISGHRDYRMLFRYTHLKAEDVVNKLE